MRTSNDDDFLPVPLLKTMDGFAETLSLQHVVRHDDIFLATLEEWEPRVEVGMEILLATV